MKKIEEISSKLLVKCFKDNLRHDIMLIEEPDMYDYSTSQCEKELLRRLNRYDLGLVLENSPNLTETPIEKEI